VGRLRGGRRKMCGTPPTVEPGRKPRVIEGPSKPWLKLEPVMVICTNLSLPGVRFEPDDEQIVECALGLG